MPRPWATTWGSDWHPSPGPVRSVDGSLSPVWWPICRPLGPQALEGSSGLRPRSAAAIQRIGTCTQVTVDWSSRIACCFKCWHLLSSPCSWLMLVVRLCHANDNALSWRLHIRFIFSCFEKTPEGLPRRNNFAGSLKSCVILRILQWFRSNIRTPEASA